MDQCHPGARDATDVASMGAARGRARSRGRSDGRRARLSRGRAARPVRREAPRSSRVWAGSTRKWATRAPRSATSAAPEPGVFTPYATYVIIAMTAIVSLFVLYGPSPTSDNAGQPAAARQAGRPARRVLAPADRDAGPRQPHPPWLEHVRAVDHRPAGRGALRPRHLRRHLPARRAWAARSPATCSTPRRQSAPAARSSACSVSSSCRVYVHKPALARQARALTSQIGILIVINLVIGFAPGSNIDYMAHIGGLIVGAGWVSSSRPAAPRRWPPSGTGRPTRRGRQQPSRDHPRCSLPAACCCWASSWLSRYS